MGLIGTWLGNLYHGDADLMSPLDFLARPERWLQRYTAIAGTCTAAPFRLRALPAAHPGYVLAGLDLSCWRLAQNGAEPVG
jgi:hypothetical protein